MESESVWRSWPRGRHFRNAFYATIFLLLTLECFSLNRLSLQARFRSAIHKNSSLAA